MAYEHDLDVLVVVHEHLSSDEKSTISNYLLGQTLPVPAATLELSVVTLSVAQTPSDEPRYELHVGNTHDRKAADGKASGR